MKKAYPYIVAALLAAILAILYRRQVTLRPTKLSSKGGNHLSLFTSHLSSPSLFQVDDTADRPLECKYQPGKDVSGHLDVIDIVNKRMRLLQRNRHSYNHILLQAKNNRWNPYHAFYNEALRQLVHEGLLVYNSKDACAPVKAE